MIDISREVIEERKNTLKYAKTKLKEYFIGIDDVIDEIIKHITPWYIYPELLTKPTIINLWGMTGCGKTDLVNKLVEFLDMSDRFVNIDLSIYNDNDYKSSILDAFYMNKITTDKHAVLLLDEFQKYDLNASKYSTKPRYDDVWKLLSEGKLIDTNKRIKLFEYNIREIKNDAFVSFTKSLEWLKPDNNEKYVDSPPKGFNKEQWEYLTGGNNVDKISQTRNINITDLLSIINISDEDIEYLWNQKQLLSEPSEYLYTKTICNYALDRTHYLKILLESCNSYILYNFYNKKYIELKEASLKEGFEERYIYSKLLIFISGNLDDVFHQQMDTDISIKELRNITENITIDDIKKSLYKIFRPEQVSRLGPTHIIFRSLTLDNLVKLLERELNKFIYNLRDKFDNSYLIDLNKVLEKYLKYFTENNVYPKQGVRSIIYDIQNKLNQFIIDKLINKTGDI